MECLKNEPLKWQAYITLIIDTGCRRGEICGLRWQSVNFKDKTITIENNLVYTSAKKGGKGVFEDTPKTDASARVIDISDDASDLLRSCELNRAVPASHRMFFAGWPRRANAPDLADAIF